MCCFICCFSAGRKASKRVVLYVTFLPPAAVKTALGFTECCERYAPSHQRKAVLGFYVLFLSSATRKERKETPFKVERCSDFGRMIENLRILFVAEIFAILSPLKIPLSCVSQAKRLVEFNLEIRVLKSVYLLKRCRTKSDEKAVAFNRSYI